MDDTGDHEKAVNVDQWREQLERADKELQYMGDRCSNLERIVSTVVDRFFMFTAELNDVRAEWKAFKEGTLGGGSVSYHQPRCSDSSTTITSSSTTVASAASSSSSLNLLMQLKDELNGLNLVEGDSDGTGDVTPPRGQWRSRSRRQSEDDRDDGGDDDSIKMGEDCKGPSGDIKSPAFVVQRNEEHGDGQIVARRGSGGSGGSGHKRDESDEDDPGDVTMMEYPEDYGNNNTSLRPTTIGEYTALMRRLSHLETNVRVAMQSIDTMNATNILESIDSLRREFNRQQEEMKTQRSLDRGNLLVLDDTLRSLKKERAEDADVIQKLEQRIKEVATAAAGNDKVTDDLLEELRAEFDKIDHVHEKVHDTLRQHTEALARMSERADQLELATSKMITTDGLKACLTEHATELRSEIEKSSFAVRECFEKVEHGTSKPSDSLTEVVSDFEELDVTELEALSDASTQDSDSEEEDEYYDATTLTSQSEEYCDPCTCSMCKEGKPPKVLTDLLKGHRGQFDAARIATRNDLLDIRDALNSRQRRTSFLDDTRHYFGEGVRCELCGVTIREGVALLTHVSTERHIAAACILKEDLRFWWNRIKSANEKN